MGLNNGLQMLLFGVRGGDFLFGLSASDDWLLAEKKIASFWVGIGLDGFVSMTGVCEICDGIVTDNCCELYELMQFH